MSAWFGDLGDGVHKGDENDPRVALIEVIPDEIRYWVATRGTVGRTIDIAVSAMTGKGAAPGELRTITKDEVRFILRIHGFYRISSDNFGRSNSCRAFIPSKENFSKETMMEQYHLSCKSQPRCIIFLMSVS